MSVFEERLIIFTVSVIISLLIWYVIMIHSINMDAIAKNIRSHERSKEFILGLFQNKQNNYNKKTKSNKYQEFYCFQDSIFTHATKEEIRDIFRNEKEVNGNSEPL